MTSQAVVSSSAPIPRAFWIAFGLNLLWVNASEVFRYFAFVMPMMRKFLSAIPEAAPMNFPIFMIWGVWDTIVIAAVTTAVWLALAQFGRSVKVAFIAGTCVWAAIFVVLWLGVWNMNLASGTILLTALSLAWLEMFVASLITLSCLKMFS